MALPRSTGPHISASTPGALDRAELAGKKTTDQKPSENGCESTEEVEDKIERECEVEISSGGYLEPHRFAALEPPPPPFDEPGIPIFIKDPSQYEHSHSRAWSAGVASYDAFIFVTPEYNWGYPAAIKNAIDYLFTEWNGKPATVVSYGGHGGAYSNAQLRQVLQGVHMRVTDHNVEVTFPSKEYMLKAAKGGILGLESGSVDANGDGGVWVAEKEKIVEAYTELVQLMDTDTHV